MTPSSEASLSDMSPAPTGPSAAPPTKESRSASKQLTELAQLVQEHYAYTANGPEGAPTQSGQS